MRGIAVQWTNRQGTSYNLLWVRIYSATYVKISPNPVAPLRRYPCRQHLNARVRETRIVACRGPPLALWGRKSNWTRSFASHRVQRDATFEQVLRALLSTRTHMILEKLFGEILCWTSF